MSNSYFTVHYSASVDRKYDRNFPSYLCYSVVCPLSPRNFAHRSVISPTGTTESLNFFAGRLKLDLRINVSTPDLRSSRAPQTPSVCYVCLSRSRCEKLNGEVLPYYHVPSPPCSQPSYWVDRDCLRSKKIMQKPVNSITRAWIRLEGGVP